METVQGPVVPRAIGCVIYQVTLASGMIVTSPAMFGSAEEDQIAPQVVVAEDGRVLVAPKDEAELR